jgi:hypothetical protein
VAAHKGLDADVNMAAATDVSIKVRRFMVGRMLLLYAVQGVYKKERAALKKKAPPSLR